LGRCTPCFYPGYAILAWQQHFNHTGFFSTDFYHCVVYLDVTHSMMSLSAPCHTEPDQFSSQYDPAMIPKMYDLNVSLSCRREMLTVMRVQARTSRPWIPRDNNDVSLGRCASGEVPQVRCLSSTTTYHNSCPPKKTCRSGTHNRYTALWH
jgi:hypothetical protein